MPPDALRSGVGSKATTLGAIPSRPWVAGVATLIVDLAALFCAGLSGFAVRWWLLGGILNATQYWELVPLLGVFPAMYGLMGAYPGFGVGPVEELRRLTLGTSLVFLVLAGSSFFFKTGMEFSRGVYLLAWIFSLVSVPLGRAAVRAFVAERPWWGEAVIILGAGKTGRLVADALARSPGLGLRPVALLDDDPLKHGMYGKVPVFGGLEIAAAVIGGGRIRRAIVAMPGVSRPRLLQVLRHFLQDCRTVTIVPELFGLPSLWVSTTDLDGILGLDIRNELLRPGAQRLKRLVDASLSGILLLVLAPLYVVIALAIKLDSRGPIMYGNTRLGRGGTLFTAWKFRTMVVDAEGELARILRDDPELARQYHQYHKIPDDPRVTRIGKLLRKWSLDELPQLWNVLTGEMSLVGPRAYLTREAPDMKDAAGRILKVAPGITGLWQVSGRNRMTFEERLRLDEYYVRNWSLWLDLYLLARTIPAVLSRDGAY